MQFGVQAAFRPQLHSGSKIEKCSKKGWEGGPKIHKAALKRGTIPPTRHFRCKTSICKWIIQQQNTSTQVTTGCNHPRCIHQFRHTSRYRGAFTPGAFTQTYVLDGAFTWCIHQSFCTNKNHRIEFLQIRSYQLVQKTTLI